MSLLSSSDVSAALVDLPGWSGDTDELRRTVECTSFASAILAVVAVAEIAGELDHHPDIDIRWRTLHFAVSTHSAGGVTAADVGLCRRIDTAIVPYSR